MDLDSTDFDEDDSQFAEHLESLYPMQLHVVEMLEHSPASDVSNAAKWLASPDEMLQGFVDAFNNVMKHSEYFETGGEISEVQVRVKNDLDVIDRMFLTVHVFTLLGSVRLMQLQGVETALDTVAIRDAMDARKEEDWERFTIAIYKWRDSIQTVGKLIRIRKQLASGGTFETAKTAKSQSRTATFEEYRRAWLDLEKEGIEPTRENLKKVIRHQFSKTLGTDRFTTYRTQMLKVLNRRPSAVRPPESAD